jgi:hypothetical protein
MINAVTGSSHLFLGAFSGVISIAGLTRSEINLRVDYRAAPNG